MGEIDIYLDYFVKTNTKLIVRRKRTPHLQSEVSHIYIAVRLKRKGFTRSWPLFIVSICISHAVSEKQRPPFKATGVSGEGWLSICCRPETYTGAKVAFCICVNLCFCRFVVCAWRHCICACMKFQNTQKRLFWGVHYCGHVLAIVGSALLV